MAAERVRPRRSVIVSNGSPVSGLRPSPWLDQVPGPARLAVRQLRLTPHPPTFPAGDRLQEGALPPDLATPYRPRPRVLVTVPRLGPQADARPGTVHLRRPRPIRAERSCPPPRSRSPRPGRWRSP